MKSPLTKFNEKILGPAYHFIDDHFGRSARHGYCKSIANFIFEKSIDMSLIMIVLNSFSLISSHIAQIKSLKKSKRENKDYLINQEKIELGLDLCLTTVPPTMINHVLRKQLEGGKISTKKTLHNLRYVVAPAAGVKEKELCDTSHILPYWENVKNGINSIGYAIKTKCKFIPKEIRKKLKFHAPDLNVRVPSATITDMAIDADISMKSGFKDLYNHKAYDDIVGGINGTLIISTFLYLTLISNILMPIIRNLLANRRYKKELERSGETSESLKRKNTYNCLKSDFVVNKTKTIPEIFKEDNIEKPKVYTPNINYNLNKKDDLFSDFRNSHSTLRI